MTSEIKNVQYTADYLRTISDEANRWRTEFNELMMEAHRHANEGHFGFEAKREISAKSSKHLHELGFKVHANKRTVSWQ